MKRLITTALQSTALMALSVHCFTHASAGLMPDLAMQGAVEGRQFVQEAQYAQQHDSVLSVWAEPELVWEWGDTQRLTFKPFYRYDSADDERTHGDIREFMWLTYGANWEIRAGIGKVFWGVTESQHLVDIINQTDLVEAPDGEEKLGQPMVQVTWLHDIGTLEAFILPGFRERTFAGEEGRLRSALLVSDEAAYQAEEEQEHIDWALRWSRSFDVAEAALDLSVAWFQGTARDPFLTPEITLTGGGPQVSGLAPYYPLQRQLGITAQTTVDAWLWKLEVLRRDYDEHVADNLQAQGVAGIQDYSAAVGGFEYTLVGPFAERWDSALDIGLLLEYQYDQRADLAPMAQNDLFAATRLAFNDADSSEILAGITQDLDASGSRGVMLEASTRLSDFTTLKVNGWIFMADDQDDTLAYSLRQDDYIEVSLNFFY
ncbi:MAG: hypothetical protein LRY66_04930 [Saccharospirillaceae bacterium]|nr:hypothetical protein [Saccharospirillaceae bacterium]MCD8530701.1 hypothetical protein [Saccharospirillaceae bacterium]